jgi:hypothetical protein
MATDAPLSSSIIATSAGIGLISSFFTLFGGRGLGLPVLLLLCTLYIVKSIRHGMSPVKAVAVVPLVFIIAIFVVLGSGWIMVNYILSI